MAMLLPGDTAPWFKAKLVDGPADFLFDKLAGRPILLLFMGSSTWPNVMDALRQVAANRAFFDDQRCCFFGVSIDAADADQQRIQPQRPGIRFFDDRNQAISRAYAAIETAADGTESYHPHWVLLDQTLRVVATAPLTAGEEMIARTRAFSEMTYAPPAPVLVVPRVFEPDMCRRLIDLYGQEGGVDSGFMNQINGRTVGKIDHSVKKRADYHITDPALQEALGGRMTRFLVPPIKRAFQFDVTHLERFIVACYDDQDGGGHFRAHRDDTTDGTAHRKFACTINLNAEDYEGGDLRFPEYGPTLYRAPTGGAIIFSCSLLHEVKPVTRGRRFAFLPFLHDEAAQRIREANMHLIDEVAAATA